MLNVTRKQKRVPVWGEERAPIFKKVVSEVLTGDTVLQHRLEGVREGVFRDRSPGARNSAEALRQQ